MSTSFATLTERMFIWGTAPETPNPKREPHKVALNPKPQRSLQESVYFESSASFLDRVHRIQSEVGLTRMLHSLLLSYLIGFRV